MNYQEEVPNQDVIDLMEDWVRYSFSPRLGWMAETKKRREALLKDDDNA